MSETILPADTYIVLNKTIINESDRKTITMLYQPIIGHAAVSLYLTLIDDLLKRDIMSDELTHHHLMATLQLKLGDIVIAREKLEAIGLIKTYLRKDNVNNYVYVIYSPLSVHEFLNHPMLSVVLYNNLGKKEYEKIVNYFKVPKINLRDYEDVTATFNEVFKVTSGNMFVDNNNVIEKTAGKVNIHDRVDFNLLISSIPKSMVNDKCFSEETRNLINSLSLTYNIDDLNMQGLVRNSLNEKGLIDKNEFINSCRSFYQFESAGKLPTLIYSKQPDYLKSPKGDTSNRAKMIYTFENVTPNDYLRSKYKNGEPTMRELQIIEDLMVKQKMKPGVVNVLISYVLKVNNQKFTRSYIEAIASQWNRLHIETVEEAMQAVEKEYGKNSRKVNKTKTYTGRVTTDETVPEWFNKDIKAEEMTKEEQEELDNLLREITDSN